MMGLMNLTLVVSIENVFVCYWVFVSQIMRMDLMNLTLVMSTDNPVNGKLRKYTFLLLSVYLEY